MSLDLSNMTQLAAGFNVTAATANGNAPSGISGVSISKSGSLTFNYANGTSSAAYDIPLANVVSPDNLASVNGSAYLPTPLPALFSSGPRAAQASAQIEASSLESSTVDLATELTDMIQAQSAYEANSKVFQTGRQHSRRPERAEAVRSKGLGSFDEPLDRVQRHQLFLRRQCGADRCRLEQHRQRQYARLFARDRECRDQFLWRRGCRFDHPRGQRRAHWSRFRARPRRRRRSRRSPMG